MKTVISMLHPVEWLLIILALFLAFMLAGCFRLCLDKEPGKPVGVSGTVTLPATITINQTQPATLPN